MNFSTILVPLDFSDVSASVVEVASEMARAFNGRLVLLHVSEPEPDFVGFEAGPASVRTAVAHDMREEHQELERWKQLLAERGISASGMHIQGSLSEKILSESVEQGAGMIVMGSHGHGALYHLLTGSVASAVLKSSTIPVLIIPAAKPQA